MTKAAGTQDQATRDGSSTQAHASGNALDPATAYPRLAATLLRAERYTLKLTREQCENACKALRVKLRQERYLFVLLCLSRNDGFARVSTDYLARELRCSAATVERLNAWLRTTGYFRVRCERRRPGSNLVCNVYTPDLAALGLPGALDHDPSNCGETIPQNAGCISDLGSLISVSEEAEQADACVPLAPPEPERDDRPSAAPEPSRGASRRPEPRDGAADTERLGKGPARRHAAPPKPSLSPPVAHALAGLPRALQAARLLARSGLTEPEQQRVVNRVREYHESDKGPLLDAGAFARVVIGDVLDERALAADLAAEAKAAIEVREHVPDGGPLPEHLKPHADYLPSRRRAPAPRDPLADRLAADRARLAIMPAAHPRRAQLEASIAELEAELARRKQRNGLRLIT